MAELRIPIVVENKGKKALGDTSKSVNSLDKNVKQLGKSLAAVFGAQQLLKFAKNAASAFIEDQREATRLAIAVKNLGLAFEAPAIEDYIDNLSRLSGVTDSQLRPSMQALLQITGSVTESQKILNQALDVAAATGIDVATVSQDIGRAYTGNTRGLRKYNLGLTQAELTTSSYVDVQARLNTLFGGANSAQLQTYAGQMSLLTVAAGEASETIGKGLINAMITLTESKDVTDFVNKIDSVAQSISNVIGSVGRFSTVIKGLFTGATPEEIRAIFDPARNAAPLTSTNVLSIGTLKKQESARKAAETAASKRAKELAAVQKKTLDTQKQSLALQKASKTLNLEAISIEAALKGQISETDRLSLLLQKSLLEGNATLATSLSDQLDSAIKRQNELRQALLTTPKAPNPYEDWKIPADLLNYTAVSLGVSPETVMNAPQTIPVQTTDATQELLDALLAAQAAQDKADAAAAAAAAVYVKITLPDGTDMTSQARTELSNQALSGSFIDVNRVDRFRTLAI
jgi:hypothetical protein